MSVISEVKEGDRENDNKWQKEIGKVGRERKESNKEGRDREGREENIL